MALFKGIQVGNLSLKHRLALAPLTRMRAVPETLAPSDMFVEYYSQRASEGGLLITEATCVCPDGVGIPATPGIWTQEQVVAWKKVTDAVHAKGAKIFCQLWHMGRISHPSLKEHPLLSGRTGPVGASAVRWEGKVRSPSGLQDAPVPRAYETSELPGLVQTYVDAGRNAIAAGFDGVEIHSAHGYLLDQFICSSTNKRTDAYGGPPENRARLLWEITEALCTNIGSKRVAVRLSPTTPTSINFHGATDPDPVNTYSIVIKGLEKYNLAYLFLSEPRWAMGKYDDTPEKDPGFSTPLVNGDVYRKIYSGVLMGAGGFTPKTAEEAVAKGTYDIIAFGRWFISNPDLPQRLKTGVPLNKYVRATFYGGSEKGYVDYPTWEQYQQGTTNGYTLLEQRSVGATLKSSL
eukprot:TRINITY_DN1455_c0_g1_i1.p1 TRINITY_DN1455_c0_g1~~TRINITY_DN1455_c0_g1_i1.p1  ORF type:complete len:405 (+),score=115.91 TRINITY_DN1455_c0_g1_i1:53-1267(+)